MGLGAIIRHSRQIRNEHHHHPSEHIIVPHSNVAYIGYEYLSLILLFWLLLLLLLFLIIGMYECPTGHRFFTEQPKEVKEVNVGGVLNLSNVDSLHPNKGNPHKSRSRGSRHRYIINKNSNNNKIID